MKKDILIPLIAVLSVSVIVIYFISRKRTPTIKITPSKAKHGDLIKIEAFNFPPNIVLYGISSDTPPEGEVIGTTSNNGYLAIELVLGVAAPIGQNLIRVVGYILQDSNIVVYEAHAYLEVLE